MTVLEWRETFRIRFIGKLAAEVRGAARWASEGYDLFMHDFALNILVALREECCSGDVVKVRQNHAAERFRNVSEQIRKFAHSPAEEIFLLWRLFIKLEPVLQYLVTKKYRDEITADGGMGNVAGAEENDFVHCTVAECEFVALAAETTPWRRHAALSGHSVPVNVPVAVSSPV